MIGECFWNEVDEGITQKGADRKTNEPRGDPLQPRFAENERGDPQQRNETDEEHADESGSDD